MHFRNKALHKYTIVGDQIGKGGQGRVYKVRKQNDSEQATFALKILTNSDYVELFEREAVLLNKLEHKHIVPIYETSLDENQGEAYILMQYMNQGNILEYITNTKDVSLEQKISLMQHVIEGIEYAHSQDIIHRDIKPENIFVHAEHNKVYGSVGDFGIAKNILEETATVTGADTASLFYLPPEYIDNREKRTVQHDLYALGISLYEVLTLEHPYSKTLSEFFRKIHSEYVPRVPSDYDKKIPSQLDEICLKAISKNQEVRYTSITELKSDLLEVAEILKPSVSVRFSMANDYLYGTNGINKDFKKAQELYEQLAKQDDPASMNKLGEMYYYGCGVEQSDSEAVKWYRKSAELGNGRGMVKLGEMYRNGYGVKKDDDEAVKWFRKSAELGINLAMYNLGLMYRHGDGVKQDDVKAVKWFRKLAELGNSRGMVNLGEMYRNGRGVKKDDDEAVKWFRKSAALGDHDGMCNLGMMYEEGRGVKQNDGEAVKWYEKSAEGEVFPL